MKIKLIYILDNNSWNYGWEDYDGYQDILDYINDMIHQEQKIITEYAGKDIKIIHAFVVDSHKADDGKYQCCTCEHYFDIPDKDSDDIPYCPYCGSYHYVKGCIDEPEPIE